MSVVLTNNAVTRLASSLTSGATTLSVTTGDGNKFPVLTAGQWFPMTLIKSTGVLEIVRCTARSGDVFTVTRGQESTSAQGFAAGDRVELRLTAAAVADLQTLIGEALRKDDNLAALTDKAASRTNLGLKTGATTDKQTSVTDVTAGSLLIVGAHGVGAGVAAAGLSNLNNAVVGSVVEVNGVNSDAATYNWPVLGTIDGAVGTDPVRYSVVTSGSDLYTIQRAVFVLSAPSRVKGRGFIRLRINGTWQPWGADVIEGTYGIGRTPLLLTSTENLNNITVFGRYQWASGSLPTNYPFSSSGYLEVAENNGADIIQVATDRTTLKTWQRSSANGTTWSAWALQAGMYESPEQTITAGGALTLPHLLGSPPKKWERFLICKTAELGYSVGDIVDVPGSPDYAYNFGVAVVPDATNLNCRYGSATGVFFVLNKSTGNAAAITPGNWKAFFRAWP